MSEAFVTQSIANHLAATGWRLVAVAAPGMGAGTILRPNPGERGRRPKLKGAVVIDTIATREGTWVFLENKDHFSLRDLRKLAAVRDTGDYSQDLEALTGMSPANRLFGLGMPDTPANRRRAAQHTEDLDAFLGVAQDGRCVQFAGGAGPL